MENDRLNDYLQSIENGVDEWGNDVQIIMVVVAQKRPDVYNGIKQLTLVQLGIPSQVDKYFYSYFNHYIKNNKSLKKIFISRC